MSKKIQQYRGLEKDLTVLEEGRIAFTTDTKKMFIGSNAGNIENPTKEQVDNINRDLEILSQEQGVIRTQISNIDSSSASGVAIRLDKIGKLSSDFTNWTDLSEYIKNNRLINSAGVDNGNVKIIIPSGDFYIKDVNVFNNFAKRIAGLTFSGSGRDITRIHFAPTVSNQYLFKNDDKVLGIHFEDVAFIGDLTKGTNFMLSISNGGSQNYTFSRCDFTDFNKVFDLQGTNNNSEFTFNHCGFYGTIKDGVLFVGDTNTSSASDQFLNYNFFACQFEVQSGNFINMKYGGNVNVYGGSFILINGDTVGVEGGTFFKLGLNAGYHSFGVCRLLVMGTRFEFRNRNAKLIHCEWEFGNVEFLNCDMDCSSMYPDSVNWEVAKFLGRNTFPNIKFNNCSLLGKHHYLYNSEGGNYVNSIVYESCSHNLLEDIEDFFTYSSEPSSNFYNIGAKPAIKVRDFRVDKLEIFDTTVNGLIHGATVLDKKVLSISDEYGSFPSGGDSITVKLPPNAIITKIMLYCPEDAVTSYYDSLWTLSTNETTPTVLASTSAVAITPYRDGFNIQKDTWFVCDTDQKRTLVLKDNEGVDQSTTKGLCLIEYIQ